MKITYKRVAWFDVRNFLGFDTPEEVIKAYNEHVQRSSVMWLGQLDGVDAAACGLISASLWSDTAYIWMLHSELSKRNSIYFMLWSQLVLKEIFQLYSNLIGWCRCDNEPAQKWMRWLGAEVDNKPRRIPNVEGECYSFRITRP